MSLSMRLQRGRLHESPLTYVAGVRTFARVYTLVSYYVTLVMKSLAASSAHVRPFVRVSSAVRLQIEFLEK